MYNKRQFTKTDDRKVMHKIRKHWVVLSLSMLMMLGGAGLAVSSQPVHAADNAVSNSTQVKNTPNVSKTNYPQTGKTNDVNSNKINPSKSGKNVKTINTLGKKLMGVPAPSSYSGDNPNNIHYERAADGHQYSGTYDLSYIHHLSFKAKGKWNGAKWKLDSNDHLWLYDGSLSNNVDDVNSGNKIPTDVLSQATSIYTNHLSIGLGNTAAGLFTGILPDEAESDSNNRYSNQTKYGYIMNGIDEGSSPIQSGDGQGSPYNIDKTPYGNTDNDPYIDPTTITGYKPNTPSFTNVKTIDVSGLDLKHANSTAYMFANLPVTTIYGLSYLKAPYVTNTAHMFENDSNLANTEDVIDTPSSGTATAPAGVLDLSQSNLGQPNNNADQRWLFDTANMFAGDTDLTDIHFPVNFAGSISGHKLKYAANMFNGDSNLQTLNLDSMDTTNADETNMLSGTTSLNNLILGSYSSLDDDDGLSGAANDNAGDFNGTNNWEHVGGNAPGDTGNSFNYDGFSGKYDPSGQVIGINEGKNDSYNNGGTGASQLDDGRSHPGYWSNIQYNNVNYVDQMGDSIGSGPQDIIIPYGVDGRAQHVLNQLSIDSDSAGNKYDIPKNQLNYYQLAEDGSSTPESANIGNYQSNTGSVNYYLVGKPITDNSDVYHYVDSADSHVLKDESITPSDLESQPWANGLSTDTSKVRYGDYVVIPPKDYKNNYTVKHYIEDPINLDHTILSTTDKNKFDTSTGKLKPVSVILDTAPESIKIQFIDQLGNKVGGVMPVTLPKGTTDTTTKTVSGLSLSAPDHYHLSGSAYWSGDRSKTPVSSFIVKDAAGRTLMIPIQGDSLSIKPVFYNGDAPSLESPSADNAIHVHYGDHIGVGASTDSTITSDLPKGYQVNGTSAISDPVTGQNATANPAYFIAGNGELQVQISGKSEPFKATINIVREKGDGSGDTFNPDGSPTSQNVSLGNKIVGTSYSINPTETYDGTNLNTLGGTGFSPDMEMNVPDNGIYTDGDSITPTFYYIANKESVPVNYVNTNGGSIVGHGIYYGYYGETVSDNVIGTNAQKSAEDSTPGVPSGYNLATPISGNYKFNSTNTSPVNIPVTGITQPYTINIHREYVNPTTGATEGSAGNVSKSVNPGAPTGTNVTVNASDYLPSTPGYSPASRKPNSANITVNNYGNINYHNGSNNFVTFYYQANPIGPATNDAKPITVNYKEGSTVIQSGVINTGHIGDTIQTGARVPLTKPGYNLDIGPETNSIYDRKLTTSPQTVTINVNSLKAFQPRVNIYTEDSNGSNKKPLASLPIYTAPTVHGNPGDTEFVSPDGIPTGLSTDDYDIIPSSSSDPGDINLKYQIPATGSNGVVGNFIYKRRGQGVVINYVDSKTGAIRHTDYTSINGSGTTSSTLGNLMKWLVNQDGTYKNGTYEYDPSNHLYNTPSTNASFNLAKYKLGVPLSFKIPVKPIGESGPTGPGAGGGPVGPSNPTTPTGPSNPTTPTGPSNPTTPTGPSNPTTPTGPSKPSRAVNTAPKHSSNSNQLPNVKPGSTVNYHGYKITRLHQHNLYWVYNIKTICLHSKMANIGSLRDIQHVIHVRDHDYWHVNRIFLIHGKHGHNLLRYQINVGKHIYYITGNQHFVRNAYVQPQEFKAAKKNHHYAVIKNIGGMYLYNSKHFTLRNRIRGIKHGRTLKVRKLFKMGYDHQTRFETLEGHYVTANKTSIKLL